MFGFHRGTSLFAVGHIALAYLLGKVSARALKVNFIVPLVLVLSIIPDIDLPIGLLFNSTDFHRGPTHSLISAFLIFIPFFIVYRQKVVPYFLALISHSVIGDLFIGGHIQLLWPLTPQQYALYPLIPIIYIDEPINIALEITLFAVATAVMVKTKDILGFFRNHKSNLVLVIPIFTVLLPALVGYPFDDALLLTLPTMGLVHLFYFILFSIAVLVTIKSLLFKTREKNKEEKRVEATGKSTVGYC